MSVYLAPSHAARWLQCPGSIRAVDALPPEDKAPSEDARHGDGCHLLLGRAVEEQQSPLAYVGRSLVLDGRSYRDLPMDQRVFVPSAEDAAAVDHAYQRAKAAREAGLTVDVEERVEIPLYMEQFDLASLSMRQGPIDVRISGRIDLRITGDDFVEVIDYKHGVRHVSEIGNLQMLLYLLGVAAVGLSKDRAVLTIVQPRSTRTDVPVVRSWEVPWTDLPMHRQRLTEGARRCLDPEAPLIPGDHCAKTFCPARGSCPALASVASKTLTGATSSSAMALATEDTDPVIRMPVETAPGASVRAVPDDLPFALAKPPDELSLGEIANILDAEEMIRSWLKAVRGHAYKLAMAGTRIPRQKLGKGSRSRKWTLDGDELRKKLSTYNRIGEDGKAAGKLKKEHYLIESVLSPNQAQQKIKPLVSARTWKSIEKLWEWKDGEPVLVSESDSREEYVVQSPAEVFGVDQTPDFLK